jgi:putative RNA 2'-phosphotransferase
MKTLDMKSKLLSFILRHKPESVGVVLDDEGWANVTDLLTGIAGSKGGDDSFFTLADLGQIVVLDSKGRYALREFDGVLKVRAVHGHSVSVSTGTAQQPPQYLYHGTATRFLESIAKLGLVRGTRQHVHLSDCSVEAAEVGARHGTPKVLRVAALDMFNAGHTFLISDSGIWLTESVPANFIVANLD